MANSSVHTLFTSQILNVQILDSYFLNLIYNDSLSFCAYMYEKMYHGARWKYLIRENLWPYDESSITTHDVYIFSEKNGGKFESNWIFHNWNHFYGNFPLRNGSNSFMDF